MSSSKDAQVLSSISQYIALIGRGQKSGKTLSQAQAEDVMLRIFRNEALPEQTGALLMLLRMREETDEELSGFLQACRATLPNTLQLNTPIDLDLGCYAGKRRHLPWLLLAVKTLAQNGYKIFLHGLEEHDSNRLYLDSVFRALNWPIARSMQDASQQLALHNFCYMSITDVHPKMANLLSMRHTLGLRSCMHTLAKMLNPAAAKASVHGVFHRELDNTHINVAKNLNEVNVACIRGDSGEVEATPEKAFSMHYVSNNCETELAFPALLPHWAHQTRNLGINALLDVWQGKVVVDYATAAIQSTLAVYLCCMHNLSSEQGLQRAKALWQSRKVD
ncbi:MAG: glycosyl transferase family protein [Glaciecola sp.]